MSLVARVVDKRDGTEWVLKKKPVTRWMAVALLAFSLYLSVTLLDSTNHPKENTLGARPPYRLSKGEEILCEMGLTLALGGAFLLSAGGARIVRNERDISLVRTLFSGRRTGLRGRIDLGKIARFFVGQASEPEAGFALHILLTDGEVSSLLIHEMNVADVKELADWLNDNLDLPKTTNPPAPSEWEG